MPAQSRRSSSRPTRAQRRAGVTPRSYTVPTAGSVSAPEGESTQTARTYSVPTAASTRSRGTAPRRFFSAEPTPVDYRREWYFVRHDLIRILLIAGVLIVAMIALQFVF